jgi:Ni/Co efflux regulator RcnB
MKKFILALLAATVATSPVLAAPDHGRDDRRVVQTQRTIVQHNGNRTVTQKKVVVRRNDQRPSHRSWRKGERFESRYAQNYRVISKPRQYRLKDAPRGYRWVQSGNDAVLVGITSGIIASVLANVIR